jgi:hypothetical protein
MEQRLLVATSTFSTNTRESDTSLSMKHIYQLTVVLSVCVFCIGTIGAKSNLVAQEMEDVTELFQEIIPLQRGRIVMPGDPFGAPVPVQDDKKKDAKKDAKKSANKSEDDVVVKRQVSKPVNPREIRMHMWDGTSITGELKGDAVTISTEFGDLRIPVEKLYGFRPGLNSYPELASQIKSLVEKLGDKDFNTRENAHKEIVSMGPQFLMEVYEYEDGGNAERKRHLKEIREELESMAEDADSFDDVDEKSGVAMIRGDSVQTKDFTVVGKIKEATFAMKTKYGDLSIKLSDIKFMDRQMTGGGEVRKTIKVMGNNMLGKNLKSSGIRVEKGDVISITASGSITMTPWGSNRASDPDGKSTYSNFSGMHGGTLAIQIGNNKAIKVGKKKVIKAPAAGMLKFGIAIPTSYQSYSYPGEYKVRVKVVAN